jgi:hypothetical protein
VYEQRVSERQVAFHRFLQVELVLWIVGLGFMQVSPVIASTQGIAIEIGSKSQVHEPDEWRLS